MRYLIIHAHHEPASFNGALTERARTAIPAAGHELRVRDLYADGFDPVSDRRNFTTVANAGVLKQQAEEAHASEHDGFAPEIEQALADLEWCDALVFQFPLWWFGMPGILKGWVDRVLAMGRAYGGGQWYENGAFKGTRAMVSMTTGGPESMYTLGGLNPTLEEILRPVHHGVFWFTGMSTVAPFITWAPARMDDAARAARLDDYERALLAMTEAEVLPVIPSTQMGEGFRDASPRFEVTWWSEAGAVDRAALDTSIAAARREGAITDAWIATDDRAGGVTVRAADADAATALVMTLEGLAGSPGIGHRTAEIDLVATDGLGLPERP